MAAPYEYLSLTEEEACLLLDALNGHWLLTNAYPGERPIPAYHDLLISIRDSVGPDCEGARLDQKWRVEDWPGLLQRLAQLTEEQAGQVLAACGQFWQEHWQKPTADGIYAVGLR